ncbi:MAG TPA: HNH endonuclease signature motif containing protein, partial [Methanocorpusculum sp.]|nr:HNH endonuclease signature motif containing protein [Methanocorpusculum sp.]
IEQYMNEHRNDPNANELWLYFRSVIDWVENTFQKPYQKQNPHQKPRSEMKGVNWGFLYDEYNAVTLDTDDLEKKISQLMMEDDVSHKQGIYSYVLTGDERALNIRTFTDSQKRETYERQGGICKKCGGKFEIEEMEADHISPWSEGGKTISENCQMLCKDCNRRKSNK